MFDMQQVLEEFVEAQKLECSRSQKRPSTPPIEVMIPKENLVNTLVWKNNTNHAGW